ncbi:glutamyl-tRNA reductase [Desulfolucanica intricata]|uniref:glutamyl-tRNA reductase n=1 Tax=Desulfolucanica intricata TaxID=1285191 RepID=UPI0008377649|nr:glutamyl-tRNA reductase [Desulfolucanica intricata]
MLIIVVGVNHRTAPVEIREKLSFSESSIKESLAQLNSFPGIDGCVILSTCNRTEIYAATVELDDGINAIWKFLSDRSGVDIFEIKNYTYSHALYDTIRHLFRVAAGLDSMILGETQILGQVKNAYELALKYGATNRVINTLFQQALAVGKKVRSETGIDKHAVSISYTAVELAKQNLGNLDGRSVLIIGAGKMSELTAKHLVANGVSGVIVSNRSHERAAVLAKQFNGRAITFDELYKYMEIADIVISCTAASHYVVKLDKFQKVMDKRTSKKIFLIDIAVPRDIDPEIAKLPGVTLYDVDDLQNVVDSNLDERKKAALAAEDIIETNLSEFMKWLSTQFVVPTIVALRNRADEIRKQELQKALNRLGELSEHDKKIINTLANAIVNQLLHDPITQLKSYAATPQGHLYTEILQNLFNLDVEGERPKNKPSSSKFYEEMLAAAANDSSK